MKKRIIVLVICLATLFRIPVAFAYSITPWTGDGIICSTPVSIKFLDTNGNEISGDKKIADASRVIASCTVRPGKDFTEETDVSLIIAAYEKKCLVEYAISEKLTLNSTDGFAQELYVMFNKTVDGVDEIKVYLWDSIENARPLFKMGQTGNTENTIDGIIIGGETVEIDEQTKTGHVEVNAGFTDWPDVVVLTNDLIADVSVNLRGSFPLSKPAHTFIAAGIEVDGSSETAEVTVNAGGEKYNISVTQAVPQITDVRFVDLGIEQPVFIQYDVRNPKWTDELPGPNKEATTSNQAQIEKYYNGVKQLEDISLPYSDRTTSTQHLTFFLFDIAPELLGSQMFAVPFYTAQESNEGDSYTFTIDRSARVYIQDVNLRDDPSWIRAQNDIGMTASLRYQMFYEMRTSTTSGSVQAYVGNAVYYKDYEVKPGEKVTITIPSPGKGSPKLLVKYAEQVAVDHASYSLQGENVPVETTLLYEPLYIDENKETGKYQIASTVTDKGTVTGNLLFGTTTFAEEERRQLCIINFPEELEGATALKLPFDMAGAQHIDFDINASSRVYLFTNAGNQTGSISSQLLQEALGDEWKHTKFVSMDSSLAGEDIALTFRSNDNAINKYIKNNSSFYSDFVVNPGESSRRIQINLPQEVSSSTRLIVVIVPLEE